MPAAPFDRVENGYDPRQVAAFAAEALEWKRELADARAALARYAKIIGEIDDVEREAAQIIDGARLEADKIIERAHERVAIPPPAIDHRPDAVGRDQPDEMHESPDVSESGDTAQHTEEVRPPEMTREERIEAARAQLFRRRGTILPQE